MGEAAHHPCRRGRRARGARASRHARGGKPHGHATAPGASSPRLGASRPATVCPRSGLSRTLPDDARPAEMLMCACRPSRSPSGALSPRRQVVGGSLPEPFPAAARAVSSSSPYHLRRYSQPCMSPAATSSMPFRFSVVVSVMMLSSKPTRTFQVEFLIHQGCPLHADVGFPFGPASDCVCGTSATVKLHVLPRYGGLFHYSYQIMRKSLIVD